MDEKKVELTDEEIVKALKKQPPRDTVLWLEKGINATDILDLIQRLQDEKERLKIQVEQGLRDMKLEVGIRDKEIKRLEEENEKLKTLVSHFEQLEKQLSAEIERLTEENEIFKGNSPILVGRSLGKTIRAKLLAFDKMKEQNDELKKQVYELKLELQGQFDKGVKAGCLMSKVKEQQIVKDTAKKYDDFIHALICKYNSDIGDNAYGNMHREAKEFAQKYGVEVE